MTRPGGLHSSSAAEGLHKADALIASQPDGCLLRAHQGGGRAEEEVGVESAGQLCASSKFSCVPFALVARVVPPYRRGGYLNPSPLGSILSGGQLYACPVQRLF